MSIISHMGIDYDSPNVEIQDNPSATDLDNTKVPTGQTIKNYINNKSSNQGSGSFNISSTYGSGNVQYMKKNGIVRVFSALHQYSGLPANTEVTLGTLPTAYRPEVQFVIANYTGTGFFNITTDGEVKVRSQTASPYMVLYAMYYTS